MKCILFTLNLLLLLLPGNPVEAQIMNESEPNNAFSTADSLLPGKSVQGLLFPQNDDDYYQIRLSQKGLLSARVSNVAADLLIRMKLYDANFSEINYRNGQLGQNLQMDTEICDTGTYYLRVYALEQNPQLTYKFWVQIDSSQRMACLTDLDEEFPHKPAFRYYPNPARDFLVVALLENSLSRSEALFLSLYTIEGKLILRERMKNTGLFLQLPDLEKGVYLIEFQLDRGTYLGKILIHNP